jgi:signal transduction histidine kinase
MRYLWSIRLALPAVTAAAVLGVALFLSTWSVGLLQRLGDEQALARVRAAGHAAQQVLHRAGDDLDVSVRLLAERPTLRGFVDAHDVAAQRGFLERFASTGLLDGCAVLGPGGVAAGGDGVVPWPRVFGTASASNAGWSLLEHRADRAPLLVASRPLPEQPGSRVACARWLDARVARELSAQIGLAVTIVRIDEARAKSADELAVLLGQAAEDGRDGAARVDALGAFADVRPLPGGGGPAVALLETRLATSSVDASVASLRRRLRSGAALSAALAALVALLLAHGLTRPIAELSRASARIGAGDLGSPVPRSAGGEVGRLAAAMEEMRTRLLSVTSELRRRHAETAAVLTGIVEGVWAVDRERRITWINPQAAETLRVRPEEAIGRFCGDVLNPVLPSGARPCESRCPIVDARFRGSARATEHLVLRDGTRRTVVITSAPTVAEPEGDDRESRHFQVLRDETETEAARRMRDAVLANVSHEFRTPLSAQLASLEMLHERVAGQDDPALGDLVRSMERGTLRLVRLVDNLLESLRIDSGRDSIRRRPLDLAAVIGEAVEQAAPLIEQKGQTLEVRAAQPLPALTGDAPRLVQALTNLLVNANKFAPAGSTITLGSEIGAAEVTLWVEDRGPGFPDEAEGRLFEPFFRASVEEPEAQGMGLGLYIANSIARRHGGRLDARNTGTGAWIAVILPLVEADEDPRR